MMKFYQVSGWQPSLLCVINKSFFSDAASSSSSPLLSNAATESLDGFVIAAKRTIAGLMNGLGGDSNLIHGLFHRNISLSLTARATMRLWMEKESLLRVVSRYKGVPVNFRTGSIAISERVCPAFVRSPTFRTMINLNSFPRRFVLRKK